MRPIELNLASRPFRNDAPIGIAFTLLGLAAIALTAYNTYAYLTADARESALRSELSDHRGRMEQIALEADQLKRRLDEVDVATLESQAAFVSSVLRERNFSWTSLFNELERVVPWNVRLSTVRPRFDGDRLAIGVAGSAQNVKAFFAFQEALERSGSFSDVLPNQYRVSETNAEVGFDMQFEYTPAPPGAETPELERASAPAERLIVPETEPVSGAALPTAAPPASPSAASRPRAAAAPAAAPAAGPTEPPEEPSRTGRRRRAVSAAGPEPPAPAGRTTVAPLGGPPSSGAGASIGASAETGAASSTGSANAPGSGEGVKAEIERDEQGNFRRIKPVRAPGRPLTTPPGGDDEPPPPGDDESPPPGDEGDPQ